MATAASQASLSLKQAGKVVCIGRNYAYWTKPISLPLSPQNSKRKSS